MPTTSKWPKPKSEEEFEDIVVDFARIRWKDPHATRNGRRGQRQYGVDIVGRPNWLKGKLAGAQCKNSQSVALATVIAEVEKAKKFQGGLAELLVVTAADRDAALQSEVRQHFMTHPAPFHVEFVFWPDIVADLSSEDALIAKHWKGFPETSSTLEVSRPVWIDRSGVRDGEKAECPAQVSLSAMFKRRSVCLRLLPGKGLLRERLRGHR